MKTKWIKTKDLRALPKLLGADPDSLSRLLKELDDACDRGEVEQADLAQVKAELNDWVVDSLQKMERAGVQDYNSPEALGCFGFEEEG